MIVLKDLLSGRYVTTDRASVHMPRLVELSEAERFATRMDAALALSRLPLTVLVVAEEV